MRHDKVPDGPGLGLWPGVGPGVSLRAGEVRAALDVEGRHVPPVEPKVPVQVHAHAADAQEASEAETAGLGPGFAPKSVRRVGVLVAAGKKEEKKKWKIIFKNLI